MRVDRFLSKHSCESNAGIRRQLALGALKVNGTVVTERSYAVTRFCQIEWRGCVLQQNTAEYWMLHKPRGVVSDRQHPIHRSVFDLLTTAHAKPLHAAGRLDLNTSGLMLLTNNGRWSKALMLSQHKVDKVYRVFTDQPIPAEAEERFQAGLYFAYENITTLPAELQRLGPCEARLTLQEGRYHQVKRMFARLGLRVTRLHRERIGAIVLDDSLLAGQSRPLTATEVANAACPAP